MYLYSKNIYLPNQVKKSGYLFVEDGIIKDLVNQIEDGVSFEDYSDYLLIGEQGVLQVKKQSVVSMKCRNIFQMLELLVF